MICLSEVLPVSILAAPTPDEADAQRALVAIAACALGIGTAGDFGRYFRLGPEAGGRVAELVETGELIPVEVTGWGPPRLSPPRCRHSPQGDGPSAGLPLRSAALGA